MIVWLSMAVLENEPFIQLCFTGIEKPDIIFIGHADVDIIVPGDKALMPHCAEQRTAGEKIGDVVCLTDALDFLQYFKLLELNLAKRVRRDPSLKTMKWQAF